jgi:hypothetical protein
MTIKLYNIYVFSRIYLYICIVKQFFNLIIKKDGGKGPVMS